MILVHFKSSMRTLGSEQEFLQSSVLELRAVHYFGCCLQSAFIAVASKHEISLRSWQVTVSGCSSSLVRWTQPVYYSPLVYSKETT